MTQIIIATRAIITTPPIVAPAMRPLLMGELLIDDCPAVPMGDIVVFMVGIKLEDGGRTIGVVDDDAIDDTTVFVDGGDIVCKSWK